MMFNDLLFHTLSGRRTGSRNTLDMVLMGSHTVLLNRAASETIEKTADSRG